MLNLLNKHKEQMKAKLAIVTLVGLTACTLALAQNEPAADKPAETTPAAAAPAQNATIPLIQFQDVPLTTAIDNLARQAGINYIMDPKVGYGQPDERGQIKAQPNISIRWENLTAEQALNALITTYGLQISADAKTGISRVTVKDPAAAEPLVTKIVQLKFASPSNIVTSVQTVFTDKRSKVIADIRTSQLVVSATEKELEAVDKLIERLDTQTKQVLIEAKILETTLSPKSNKGVDWTSTLSNQRIAFGNGITSGNITRTKGNASGGINVGSTGGATVTPGAGNNVPTTGSTYSEQLNSVIGGLIPGVGLSTAGGFSPATAFLNADGLSVALSFLNESGDTKIISEPRIVTLDNQKAEINVGLLYPIVNISAGTANTSGGSEISYSNLTVNLDVTPRIAANNFIELKVAQSVLRLGQTFQSQVAGLNNSVDSFLKRTLDTTVLIPSGNTLVMGGLIQDEQRRGNTKVPLLGDIPFLGFFFRKDNKEMDKQNLTIFITPTVVQDSDFQPTKTEYLKTTGNDAVVEDWSWWDSGKSAAQVKKEKKSKFD
jgi:type IV pilus assembly protein PilQ